MPYCLPVLLAMTLLAPNLVSANDSPMQWPYRAFEVLPATAIPVPGGTLQVAIAPGDMALTREELLGWVAISGKVVADYFGQFPVAEAKVLVIPAEGNRVRFGNAFGHQGAAVRVFVGSSAGLTALERDWILVHELIHLAVPSVKRRHHWLEEGIAVYVESIARVRLGQLTEEFVWKGMLDGMPKGLPTAGDRGLDNTPTWGRTYWGGALFCLVADIRIRQRSENRLGLQHALRGVVEAGGSIEATWPISRILEAGDAATGVPVLVELYQAWRETPVDVNLEALWQDLGVTLRGNSAVFDDTAPLAPVRRAIGRPAIGEG